MEYHPAANIFPLMEEGELAKLADDIRENGLHHPVEFYDGKILDGRNRWSACILAGIEPDTKELSDDDIGDDALAYVRSLNLARRHLTESQRAMVAARAKEWYEERAKERQLSTLKQNSSVPENLPERGDTRDQAGKDFNVSGKSVDYASKVLEKGAPDLQKACDAGKVAVSAAAKIADADEEVQQEIARDILDGKTTGAKAVHELSHDKTPEDIEEVTRQFKAARKSLGVIGRFCDDIGCLKKAEPHLKALGKLIDTFKKD